MAAGTSHATCQTVQFSVKKSQTNGNAMLYFICDEHKTVLKQQ